MTHKHTSSQTYMDIYPLTPKNSKPICINKLIRSKRNDGICFDSIINHKIAPDMADADAVAVADADAEANADANANANADPGLLNADEVVEAAQGADVNPTRC
ncbi:PREDICTED: uncharacterized protein LOC108610176 [Drosophila arizonae]|uniref:Uncharacterized protein LOC108610176 n=1 Tax=Drosophila arizonae TaxID=7263 RepID=A0ABM1NRK2_DROAR|nr:PREDICTED: uncharacterized protein LOC108610176 [Drosophila arizonae]